MEFIEETPMDEAIKKRQAITLLVAIFMIAACGLVYELLIGSLSAYLEGDSLTHYSLTIGFFMFAMGIGSWLTRYVADDKLLTTFVSVEILLGVVGGVSGLILFSAYTLVDGYLQIMILITMLIGILVGIELPLLTRIFRQFGTLAMTLSTVLSFDYIGALLAGLTFPFVFMPWFGAVRTGLIFGFLNLTVALLTITVFRDRLGKIKTASFNFLTMMAIVGLVLLFAVSESLIGTLESSLYTDDVVFAKQSKYQRIVVTKWKNIFRLFLDGNIQFSSTDEYRYHEALVHPPMLAARKRENIAVLGGGDGMAVRELLRYPEVKSIQLVDLDPAITDLASTNPDFRSLNKDSLIDPKVRVINQDARQFLKEWQGEAFDVIIVDFPDPNNESLSKLYTRQFYQLLKQRLAAFGAVSIQSTSPLYARDAFWMINRTVEAADLHVYPYHTYVPSFGEWGFQLVGHHPIDVKNIKLIPTMKFKFLTQETLTALFTLPVDLTESGQGINSIENGNLLRVYMEGWEFWN